MTPVPIPALDPAPLPAPAWLFHLLLVVTFLVHVLFMNVVLGGTLIAAVDGLLARTAAAAGRRLARLMAGLLPPSISFAVTTGVAPLLFVQVLYAQVFYPATILVGGIWLGLLVLLVVAYYAVYLQKFEVGGGRLPWLPLAALCFLGVAGIQTLVNVLQLTPARWSAILAGTESAFRDPTLMPRLLHFIVGTVGVAGLFLAVLSAERMARAPDPFFAWLARRGVRWAQGATALEVAGGFWFLLALPGDLRAPLMGGSGPGTAILAAGLGLGLLTLFLLARIRNPERERGLLRAAAGSLLLTLVGMVGLRDLTRGLYLAPILRSGELPARTQVDLMLLFLAIFLAGLATVAWMLRTVARSRGATP